MSGDFPAESNGQLHCACLILANPRGIIFGKVTGGVVQPKVWKSEMSIGQLLNCFETACIL
jgi:hypothetical protein